jgi:hypothetical protein
MKFSLRSSKDLLKLLAYLRYVEQTDEVIDFANKITELNKILSKIRKADKTTQVKYYNQYRDTFLKDAAADIRFNLELFTGTRTKKKTSSGSKTAKKRTIKIKYNIVLSRSNRPDKRYKVVINDENIIHFGSRGKNYTMHKDKKIKAAYIKRHKKHEKWTLAGIKTPGFWSKHLLWNMSSMKESLNAIRKKYKSIKIILSRN